MTTGALEAVDRILNTGGADDDVLRAVVGVLVERGGCTWAAIRLVDGDARAPGAEAGESTGRPGARVPVVFQGDRVAELVVEGCDDGAFLERVALLVSAHCRSAREAAVVAPEEVP